MVRRSFRDEQRRALGQNFLRDKKLANALASSVGPADLVVEFGPGRGALTLPLAGRGARIIAVERDPLWADRLSRRIRAAGASDRVQVIVGDMLDISLPDEPYRVVSSPPFNRTTALLKRLLADSTSGPQRVDLIVQWEVARKRSAEPPATLLSTTWAPWWQFEIARRIPRSSFRPVPAVDGAWLVIRKRTPPVLPPEMARDFTRFVRSHWGQSMT